jgi:peptidoglycan/xylan/chitin deacetylase (PgdA/CDA1 family)
MAAGTPIHLIFHELGVEPRPYAYYVSVRRFEQYLLETQKLGSRSSRPCLTFDDGYDSNRTHALPLLASAGVKAKFFLVGGWIESRLHFMNWAGVKELVAQGHEVGSHGWSHALLTQCNDTELRDELVRSKKTIEERIGQRIDAVSMPGGRWNRRVLQGVREAGYARVYTSDPFLSGNDGQLALHGRINVTQSMSPADLGQILKEDFSVVVRMRAMHTAKTGLRRVLGEATYQRLWAAVTGFPDEEA